MKNTNFCEDFRSRVDRLNIYSIKHSENSQNFQIREDRQSKIQIKDRKISSKYSQINDDAGINRNFGVDSKYSDMKQVEQEEMVKRSMEKRDCIPIIKFSVIFKQLNQSNKFRCEKCQQNYKCQICKGEGQISGQSNFLRFIDYVLEFKLNRKKSFISQQDKVIQRQSIKSNNTINQSCRQIFSAKRQIQSKKSLQYIRFQEKVIQEKFIHTDYQCDLCQKSPIVGTRYHCNHTQCNNDTDLCQYCFQKQGHYHEASIQVIKQTGIYTNRKKTIKNLYKSFNINNSSGLRSTSGTQIQKQNRNFPNKMHKNLLQKSHNL